MINEGIRREITRSGVKYWQVAEAVGISPYTLSIWLRRELTGERLERVQKALDALRGGERHDIP